MRLEPLIKGIKQLEDRSRSGELAYLCLNGKSENHIRDIVAFNVASNKPSWNVEREINRVDLVISNARGSSLEIEFKLGYAGPVIKQRERSHVLKSALQDLEKRGSSIINCIGIMDFSAEPDIDLSVYKKSQIIRSTIGDARALNKVKCVVKDTWCEAKCKFTTVNCGVWRGINVSILFCTIKNA